MDRPVGELRADERSEEVRGLLTQVRRSAIDRLAELAAHLTGAPFAQVSLLADRQVIAGAHGFDLTPQNAESPLEASLCTVTVADGGPLAIADAAGDARVRDLPPVTSGTVGAYLGVPVVVGGAAIGALCVYGPDPRAWSAQDVETVTAIAEAVATELELAGLAAEAAQTAVRLDLGFAAASIGSFDWNLVTDELRWDERLQELFGYTPDDFVPHIESFTSRVHPDDRARVDAAIAEAVAGCGGYGTEYRVVMPSGAIRWIAARGRVLCDPRGRPERMLGAAFDVTDTHDTNERVARLLETMSSAFFSLDHAWRFTYVNAQAERLLGRGRDELVGRPVWEEFSAALGTSFEVHYRHAAETGEPVAFEEFYAPLGAWFEVRAWPTPDGLSVFFHDITDRIAAQEERAQAHERIEWLAAAGGRLSATLDPQEVLEVLGGLVVPRFGAWAAVAVRPDVAALLAGREGTSPHDELVVVHVAARDEAARRQYAAAPSAARWELRSRGQTIGELTIGHAGEDLDTELLDDLVRRAAVALDNAVLYGAERRAGIALQHLLLPSDLPRLPEIGIAARYRAGTAGRQVGGDFYIAHELDDGRLVLAIGDVMGHGMEAAARMGQLRAVLTAYALDGDRPDTVLARVVERAEDLLDVRMATLLVLVYDPGTRRLTAASAGHPPPLVAPLGGPPAYVDLRPGPPLGIGAAGYPSATVELPPGSTVVLYTDGLVENRGESIDAGLARLRDALREVRLPPEEVCDHVLGALGREQGGTDDIALLVFSHL